MTKVFPSIMIALSLASAAVYAWNGDTRRWIYWVAASVLTASVTF